MPRFNSKWCGKPCQHTEIIPMIEAHQDKEACLEWPYRIGHRGYGLIWYQGKQRLVHRLVYKFVYPEFRPDLFVLHRCDNRACFNPRHLFQGTQLDNIQDRDRKGRRYPTFGEYSGSSKLTNEQVLEIRRLYAAGMSQAELMRLFRMHRGTIWDIVHRKKWKSI